MMILLHDVVPFVGRVLAGGPSPHRSAGPTVSRLRLAALLARPRFARTPWPLATRDMRLRDSPATRPSNTSYPYELIDIDF